VIKLASRCAAIVAAGSALALAGGLVSAQAATTGWRTNTTVAVRGSQTLLTNVTASSPADAWAVGFSGKDKSTSVPQSVIRRWTGKAWRTVTLPAKVARAWARTAPLDSSVGAASARSVWVFGSFNGSYLRLSGSRWSIGRLPGAGSASSGTLVFVDVVKVFSSTDVWAFGERDLASGSVEPYAAQYNGHKWSMATVPGSGAITAVAAVSARDIWAVESPDSSGLLASTATRSALAASPAARSAAATLRAASSAATAPVVLQWTSKSGIWKDAAKQPTLAATDQLVSAVAEPGGHVWFGGSASNSANGTSPLTAEWTGTSWSVKDLPGKASSADWELGSMAPDGTGGIWALAENNASGAERIWHLHGTTWAQARPAFGKHAWILEALAVVPGTHSVWAVGAVQGRSKSSVNGLIAVDGSLPR
jgi:hypothetical protein